MATSEVNQLHSEFKESAESGLTQVLGQGPAQSVLSYISHAAPMNSPEELHKFLTLVCGEAGANAIEKRMLESLSTRLDDPAPGPDGSSNSNGNSRPSPSSSSPFDFRQSVKKTINFNRLQGLLSVMQPQMGPKADADLRMTAGAGLTHNSEMASSSYAGEYFHETFHKVRKIIVHQFKNRGTKGITGFIFYGPPGTGKTTMARALARNLALEFVYVDSSTVARSKYGESEKQVSKAFEEARRRPSLILLDDAEAMFPSRDSTNSEEFYSGQNNVLFHVLDKVDTSRVVVILTTNKFEQLDPALRDRLYPIQFPDLDLPTIVEIATLKCHQRGIPPDGVLRRIHAAPQLVTSIRYLEKLITEEYIRVIEGAPTSGVRA